MKYTPAEKSEKPIILEWSDEDKEMLKHIILDIESLKEQVYCISLCDEEIDWLKSLPSRFSLQPKQEWSEEDERMRKAVIDEIEHQIEIMPDADDMDSDDQDRYNELISMSVWMEDLPKCIKPRWKPSEEQMEALKEAAKHFGGCDPDDWEPILKSLYNDLQKL
jgi:hypothetical protein